MIGILVSGHIHYATGMQSAVEAIVGKQNAIEFIDFVPSITTEELEQLMHQSIARINTGDGVLILTDVPGGSPCNRAISIMLQRNDIKVIAGCNLPMITNACFERDGLSLDELVDVVIEIGNQSIKDMHAELKNLEACAPVYEDEL